ncbi:hypothetical protein G3I30_13740 [Actinospica acidiphila]|nr:hypothetical protein [Actinospica acidiphila]
MRHLSISLEAFLEWFRGDLPLGFSFNTYEAFVDELERALTADGIDPGDVDVRLKGSSSSFFAGRHKTLPTTTSEIVASFSQLRGRWPMLFELREIENHLKTVWPDAHPHRRPFDSMYTLGIDRVHSDYDLQVSSDAIVTKCEKYAAALGITPTREVTHHDLYNYVAWDLVRAAMPHLAQFTDLMSDALRRDVTVAVFASCGPPDVSGEFGDLSSHFKDSDWRIAGSAIRTGGEER